MAGFQPHPSSYRDPSGFLFRQNGILYRQVNQSFSAAFQQFHKNGLAQQLVTKGLLTPYTVVEQNLTGQPEWFLTLQPEFIPFFSYPYEWCFNMLKDAALTTLQLAKDGLAYGMLLKDATAYNLQWHKGQMQLVDTLSFEPYEEQKPWIAYRQFCEQFLAPLALMHYRKTPLQQLLLGYPEGISLPLAANLLPGKSRFHLHVYLHLHLQAKLAARAGTNDSKRVDFSRKKLVRLLDSLEQAVNSFSLQQPTGVWSGYYEEANEREDYVQQKKQIIAEWIDQIPSKTAFDAGANEGEFSLLLAANGMQVISADFDHFSINKLYQKVKHERIQNLHPLLLDLSNPSPAIGVNNEERASFLNRCDCDLVLALALIHHFAIGKNIDFEKIANLFRSLGRRLIIEFVPKEDEKIQLMLQQKSDVYPWYKKENFLAAFLKHYTLQAEKVVGRSGRTLYLMQPR